MHVYISRIRARSPDAAREVCRTFGHLIALHQEPGFVNGACTIKVDDPCDLLVYTRWSNRAAADYWLRSDGYVQAMAQVLPVLVEPPRDEEFEICSE